MLVKLKGTRRVFNYLKGEGGRIWEQISVSSQELITHSNAGLNQEKSCQLNWPDELSFILRASE